MAWCEQTTAVPDPKIKKSGLKLADGENAINRCRSGKVDHVRRFDGVAVRFQHRLCRAEHRCCKQVAHGEHLGGTARSS